MSEPIVQLWDYLSAMDIAIISVVVTPFCGAVLAIMWKLWVASTNCLPTIQRNTDQTNKLLTELVGYFKAKAEDGKL
jgi:hypothetical protein